jgi:signal recognition particle receptor subunit beta
MVQINFANKEIQCKIVYYGPGMSGKTTNLEVVHKKAPSGAKGDLTSIATEGDRTLFFDFMPLDLGNIAGIKTKFQLYTVPGQVYYNSTRKLVLQGVDGIVFVADSQAEKLEENVEAIENLRQNLREYGRDLDSIPVVFQWNKRDLPTALPVEEMNAKLNPVGAPTFEAVAATGEGVFPTLKALASLVLESINRDKRESGLGSDPARAGRPAASRPMVPAGPKKMAAPARAAVPAATGAPASARPAASARVAAPAAMSAPVTTAPAPAAPAEPRRPAKPLKSAEPVRGGIAQASGKVTIRERPDTMRVLITLVVAAVIIGAVGFLIMKYL